MLSEHEIFHLNAILNEVEETRNLTSDKKNKWMSNKGVRTEQKDNYLDAIVNDINKIIKNGVLPELKTTSSIHDYIEKETKGEFK